MASAITHIHQMPFGVQLLADGVRFNFWSPAVRPALVLEGAASTPMQAHGDGWYTAVVPNVGAGTQYRFELPDGTLVPDPASRFQPEDCDGWSTVVDPQKYSWKSHEWTGRSWHEAVIYEIHLGTFTPEGTFAAAMAKLGYLKSLGVTALELMPVADFPGKRGWGYDGVLPFAPDSAYGTPEQLKAFIDAAHALQLMVYLDVVYNHFGPSGNWLGVYSPDFFTEQYQTPWGAAINFSPASAAPVRAFYIHNVLYWLEEFQLDGLRFDAVHAIFDDLENHILDAIAEAVRAGPGSRRSIHLILENDANQSRYLNSGRAPHFDAQWNDDTHHALHILLTGETIAHYADYADDPLTHLGRCLTEGFGFQGEWSGHRQARRGESSVHLPASAFVDFLQNHDQIGNRALGDRIGHMVPAERLRVAIALILLAPATPLLFMGEEWNASTPFLYFCDFDPNLAAKVRDGRRTEFANFPGFHDPAQREAIPDPNAHSTFASSKLDWSELALPEHAAALSFHRELLALRATLTAHRMTGVKESHWSRLGQKALKVQFDFNDGARLLLFANFGDDSVEIERQSAPVFFALRTQTQDDALCGWSMRAYLTDSPS